MRLRIGLGLNPGAFHGLGFDSRYNNECVRNLEADWFRKVIAGDTA